MMENRTRRIFTREFRAEAVKLAKESGKTIKRQAKELGLSESALRQWVKQAGVDSGNGLVGALTTAEREELSKLRRENRTLKMERELLKKWAAFFAKETA